MIALAWTLGSIMTYALIGWRVAAWDLPHAYARQKEEHPSWAHTKIRSEVRTIVTLIAVFWPFCLPYVVMSREVDKRDPRRLERELRALEAENQKLDAQIAELKRGSGH